MFAVELTAGLIGGSKALQADALDFLGDAANYAISLGVAGIALAWRARAALLKARRWPSSACTSSPRRSGRCGTGARPNRTSWARPCRGAGRQRRGRALCSVDSARAMRTCNRYGYARATTQSATSPYCSPRWGVRHGHSLAEPYRGRARLVGRVPDCAPSDRRAAGPCGAAACNALTGPSAKRSFLNSSQLVNVPHIHERGFRTMPQ